MFFMSVGLILWHTLSKRIHCTHIQWDHCSTCHDIWEVSVRECTAEVPEECLPGREGLKDEKAMKGQLTSHKDLDSAIVVITLPTNAYNNCTHHRLWNNQCWTFSWRTNEGTLWGVSAYYIVCSGLWGWFKIILALTWQAASVCWLHQELYQGGNCDIHPGIQCSNFKAVNGWYFDLLDSNRIKVFANQIVSCVKLMVNKIFADYEQVM